MKTLIVLFTLAAAFLVAAPVDLVIDNFESHDNSMSKSKVEKVKDQKSMTLYVRYGCPYCKTVLSFLKAQDIDIVIKDTSLEENASYLLANGKKTQVPCLFVEDKPLYESKEIISYLQKNL